MNMIAVPTKLQLVKILVLLLLLSAVALIYIPGHIAHFLGLQKSCAPNMLCVHFLAIGQGDATFIEMPDGTQLLIDGGPDSSVLRALGDYMGYFDRDIDMVIATHPDQDHIGGLVSVLDRYQVHSILLTENTNETPVSHSFTNRVEHEGAEVHYARSNQQFTFGDVVLTVLFPDRDAALFESNASSIIVQLVYGETEILLPGDAPQSVEKYLVGVYGQALISDILKIGHHGSKTSTAEIFLTTVRPQYAVISAGAGNSYGHPHHEVLSLLESHGVSVFSTTDGKTHSFISDGKTVHIKKL